MASKRSARVARAISSYSRSCSPGCRSSKPGEDTSEKILSRNRDQRFTLTYERAGCFVPSDERLGTSWRRDKTLVCVEQPRPDPMVLKKFHCKTD